MSLAQTTQETLGLMKESLAKSVTVATGLTNYDLQAPAKNLYPVITPLRNSLPRVQRLNPGDAARWRTVASIAGSGFDSSQPYIAPALSDGSWPPGELKPRRTWDAWDCDC